MKSEADSRLHSLRVWQLFLFLAVGDTLWAYFTAFILFVGCLGGGGGVMLMFLGSVT